MILSSRDLERREPACGRGRACGIFFYFGKIAFVPGRELPGQIDKAHLSRMLNLGWKTGINASWQPGLKCTSGLLFKKSKFKKMYLLCAIDSWADN